MCGSRAFPEQAAMGSEQNAEDISLPALLLAHTASEEVVTVSPGTGEKLIRHRGQDLATMTCQRTLKTWGWTVGSEVDREKAESILSSISTPGQSLKAKLSINSSILHPVLQRCSPSNRSK